MPFPAWMGSKSTRHLQHGRPMYTIRLPAESLGLISDCPVIIWSRDRILTGTRFFLVSRYWISRQDICIEDIYMCLWIHLRQFNRKSIALQFVREVNFTAKLCPCLPVVFLAQNGLFWAYPMQVRECEITVNLSYGVPLLLFSQGGETALCYPLSQVIHLVFTVCDG